jgi:hypothetical protein
MKMGAPRSAQLRPSSVPVQIGAKAANLAEARMVETDEERMEPFAEKF